MRTAVVRVTIDPTGAVTAADWRAAQPALLAAAERLGVGFADSLAEPPGDGQLRLLVAGDDDAEPGERAVRLCAEVFGTESRLGAVTYISRGTDDDARGVLARLGVRGEIHRAPGADGYDVVTARISAADLARVPESRVHTALEASLNCEVLIVAAGAV